ncbi:MAG: hypothetical protein GY800_13235 [Planctomycetes bacterium]|nr:hypothetical protein [Planctomycetota bacterium]
MSWMRPEDSPALRLDTSLALSRGLATRGRTFIATGTLVSTRSIVSPLGGWPKGLLVLATPPTSTPVTTTATATVGTSVKTSATTSTSICARGNLAPRLVNQSWIKQLGTTKPGVPEFVECGSMHSWTHMMEDRVSATQLHCSS